MNKGQVVNNAYIHLRISGLTVGPTPDDSAWALHQLELMMDELQEQKSLDIGYNFEEDPDTNSPTGVRRSYQNMMETNLAVRLIAVFNKTVPPALIGQASQSLSGAIGKRMGETTRQLRPSRRMPVGSGNMLRGEFFRRYQRPAPLPPQNKDINYILAGEIFTYQEDFTAFLRDETIQTFTITSDPLLSVSGDALDGSVINYTVEALTGTQYGPWQQVKITVTTSGGRRDIRLINFQMATPPEVP